MAKFCMREKIFSVSYSHLTLGVGKVSFLVEIQLLLNLNSAGAGS